MRRFDLGGKVAVVTGGNGGIGLGMARGLAECGAAVVIAGRNAAKNEAALAELASIDPATAASAVEPRSAWARGRAKLAPSPPKTNGKSVSGRPFDTAAITDAAAVLTTL